MEPIKKLLQTKVFSEIIQKKNEIDSLQNQLFNHLPKTLITNLQIKSYIKDILIIQANNSAAAHQLKMHESSLIKKINEGQILEHQIKKIKIKVNANHSPYKKKNVTKIPISVNKKLKTISKEMSESRLKEIINDLFKPKT
jgi:hypothetical protein